MSDNSITLLNHIQTMARSIAASNMFGNASVEAWAALMFIAHAEGKHPASVARDYHIINGRPSLRSEVILARFQQAGGSVEWSKLSDNEVVGVFKHPQGGEITITWNMERAQKAELRSPMWKKFPQQMLRARAVSEAVRAIYPVVLCGFYDEAEVRDMPPIETRFAFDAWCDDIGTIDTYDALMNHYNDHKHRMTPEQSEQAKELCRNRRAAIEQSATIEVQDNA
jgi:hypothetical protein